jgi:hypothetical protein
MKAHRAPCSSFCVEMLQHFSLIVVLYELTSERAKSSAVDWFSREANSVVLSMGSARCNVVVEV